VNQLKTYSETNAAAIHIEIPGLTTRKFQKRFYGLGRELEKMEKE
jgi:hypothetical protein